MTNCVGDEPALLTYIIVTAEEGAASKLRGLITGRPREMTRRISIHNSLLASMALDQRTCRDLNRPAYTAIPLYRLNFPSVAALLPWVSPSRYGERYAIGLHLFVHKLTRILHLVMMNPLPACLCLEGSNAR